MRSIVIFVVVLFLLNCKGEQNSKESSASEITTLKTRDSLLRIRDSLNIQIESLNYERERLLESSSAQNPVIINLEVQTFHLLNEREKIEIRLASGEFDL
ncbi:MAG: hypothetical protein HKP08_02495 [Flavobacteriaceae bacterium]|nr:hypothetical protein [Flavobacteriaceae bacterium]